MMKDFCTLSLACDDKPGLVARVAGYVAGRGGNIVDAQQFNDQMNQRFFMRVDFTLGEGDSPVDWRAGFAVPAAQDGMDWRLRGPGERKKVLLLVSKFDHCLADLLYRWRIGELAMDVVGIVSNHEASHLTTAAIGDVPFHHLPITKGTKPEQEARIRALAEDTGADLVVLARYMQILSDEMAGWLSGRCINIHHSFLPGFKGRNPIIRRMIAA
jgi:formyltetrahydrofolate deformylase